ATQSALDADGDLLAEAERTKVDGLMDALRAEIAGSDAAKIEAASEALAKGTEEFAAERMNRGIHQALTGKNVQSI
ncbi:MAG: Fe-S protein assembly chaperone HscA, partial [Comamonas sp.]